MSFPLPVVGSSAKDGDGASAPSLPFTAENVVKISVDCEQSLFFFRFSKGSARARERCAVHVVICVSRAFCSTDQEKRETARSLKSPTYASRIAIVKNFELDVWVLVYGSHYTGAASAVAPPRGTVPSPR